MGNILIVDDEPGIRTVLRDVLQDEGHTVLAAEDGLGGLSQLAAAPVDLVFLDVWLPNMGGIDVLKRVKEEFPDVEVVMISGHANINLAVQAVKMGAYDFLEKPLSLDRTLTVARNALQLEVLRRENRTLRNSLFVEDQMIGESPPMKKVRELDRASLGKRLPHFDSWREWDGQGVGRKRGAPEKQTLRGPVRGSQLRGHSGEPHRKRALRP